MAIVEWVLTGGLLAGIGYMCVRARRAAGQAALDDPVFAPGRIEAAAAAILNEVLPQDARVSRRPRVDILRVVNRERDSEDRVVVRVRAHLDAGRPGGTRLDERWTLVHRGDEWYLGADAGDPLAESLLTAPLIASPQDDAERLREARLEELIEPARPGGPSPGELADADAEPAQQPKDLSVADDRFEPLLVKAAVRHLVDAWEQSADGSDAPLLAVATGAGAHALNFPTAGRGRRRVRDARLQHWEVSRVDASATRARVVVHLRVKAAAWQTDGDAISGGDRHARRPDLHWALELDEMTHEHPRWRLTESEDAS